MLSGYVNFPRKIMERIEKGEADFTEPGIFNEVNELLKLNKPLIVTGNTGGSIIIAHLNSARTQDTIYVSTTLYSNLLVTMAITITKVDRVTYDFIV